MTYKILDRPEGGVVLNFDHNDFSTIDGARGVDDRLGEESDRASARS